MGWLEYLQWHSALVQGVMMIEGSGYYVCELRAIFHKGTYNRECFYDAETQRFLLENADVTKRVVRVIEKAVWING